MDILGQELAARLLKDARENSRLPKTLHLQFRGGKGHAVVDRAKSCPVTRSVAKILTNVALRGGTDQQDGARSNTGQNGQESLRQGEVGEGEQQELRSLLSSVGMSLLLGGFGKEGRKGGTREDVKESDKRGGRSEGIEIEGIEHAQVGGASELDNKEGGVNAGREEKEWREEEGDQRDESSSRHDWMPLMRLALSATGFERMEAKVSCIHPLNPNL